MCWKTICIACLLPLAAIAQTHDWKLVWQEEFNYHGIPDPDVWGYDYGQSIRNQESQFYTRARIENALVDNGTLKIIARKEPFDGKKDNYTSANLTTRGTREFQYGRIEVAAKLPAGRGIWPAIWMMPAEDNYGGWPRCGEIDIMEFVGFDHNRIHINIHNGKYNNLKGGSLGASFITRHIHDKFHVYALEWTPRRLDFFIDDVNVFTYQKEEDSIDAWPFDNPFYLMLNVAVGGGWGGQKGIDDSHFPQAMEVDYVRVYQKDQY